MQGERGEGGRNLLNNKRQAKINSAERENERGTAPLQGLQGVLGSLQPSQSCIWSQAAPEQMAEQLRVSPAAWQLWGHSYARGDFSQGFWKTKPRPVYQLALAAKRLQNKQDAAPWLWGGGSMPCSPPARAQQVLGGLLASAERATSTLLLATQPTQLLLMVPA